MSDAQLSFRKSANIDRVTDKRKDSLFRLVDTDGSGTIDAQEFAVLYDAIKKDLAEELEKEAALAKEASSARRRFKMLLLFVAVLVSFLAASVAANFAVIFTVVDQAITTSTSSTGMLEVKGSDIIAKTAIATQDVPLIVAPALDLETLSEVKSLRVTYQEKNKYGALANTVEASMSVVAVRKHNATFVEFVTDVVGETVEALNGVASVVRYPTAANGLAEPLKFKICAANATCSAFRASGIDVEAATDMATEELVKAGFLENGRRLIWYWTCSVGWTGLDVCGFSWNAFYNGYPAYWPDPTAGWITPCSTYLHADNDIDDIHAFYYYPHGSQRNLVFFAHGKTMSGSGMWSVICTVGSSEQCPLLKIPAFEHIMFIWASSALLDSGVDDDGSPSAFAGTVGWSEDIFDGGSYEKSAGNLAAMICSATSVPDSSLIGGCNPANGVFTGILAPGFKLLMVGFSDGGGFAAYMNFKYSRFVDKAHTIDFWNHNKYDVWIPASYSVFDKPDINMKIYTSCGTHVFQAAGGYAVFPETPTSPVTYPSGAGLGFYPDWEGYVWETNKNGTDLDYSEWKWTSPEGCKKYLKFAVHGLPADAAHPFQWLYAGDPAWNSTCASRVYGTGSVGPSGEHVTMMWMTPIKDDITEWDAGESTRRQLLRYDWISKIKGLWDPCWGYKPLYATKIEMHAQVAWNGRRMEEKNSMLEKSANRKLARGGEKMKSEASEESQKSYDDELKSSLKITTTREQITKTEKANLAYEDSVGPMYTISDTGKRVLTPIYADKLSALGLLPEENGEEESDGAFLHPETYLKNGLTKVYKGGKKGK